MSAFNSQAGCVFVLIRAAWLLPVYLVILLKAVNQHHQVGLSPVMAHSFSGEYGIQHLVLDLAQTVVYPH
jgi:hypothetical protein